MTTMITRRSFFLGVASTGFVALAKSPVAGLSSKPRPNVRIGLAADIHINQWRANTERYKAVLKFFDSAKVDGVVVAGDLADSGVKGELATVGEIWKAQFPGGRRSDGAPIANLMHYGDHDTGGYLCERDGFLKRHGLVGKSADEIAAQMVDMLENWCVPTELISQWFRGARRRKSYGMWFAELIRREILFAYYEMIERGEGIHSARVENLSAAHPLRVAQLFKHLRRIDAATTEIYGEKLTGEDLEILLLTTGKLSVEEISRRVSRKIPDVLKVLTRLERRHLIVYSLH